MLASSTASSAKQLFCEMNVLWLKPTDEAAIPASLEGAYDCPVYRTAARGAAPGEAADANCICHVRLPSAEASEAHWVKRSAALICSLDD